MRFLTCLWIFAFLSCSLERAWAEIRNVPAEYATINAALDASAPGDTVSVSPGTYTDSEMRNLSGFGPAVSVAFLKGGVTLRSTDGPDLTTLDLLEVGAPYGRVVIGVGLALPTTVDGFTIVGSPSGNSGVSLNNNAEVTVRNCILRDLSTLGGQDRAGGIAATFTDLRVEDCLIENCHSGSGGAIDQLYGRIWVIRSVVRGCSYEAIDLNGGGSQIQGAVIQDCLFENNWSDHGAGAIGVRDYTPHGALIERTRFVGNRTTTQGGGAVVLGGWYAPKTIRDCVFIDNHAETAFGGALSFGPTPATVTGNTFWGNSAPLYGAAISISTFGASVLENNIIGGSSGSPGVSLVDTSVGSSCNVFWANEDGDTEGFTLDPTDRIIDPEFCDPDAGDFTLQSTSPCLPEHSQGCGLVGALGVGCGTVSITPQSWGSIKSHYR